MGDFGWTHLSGAVTGKGVAKSIQYLVSKDGELTGSSNFTFDSGGNTLSLTGSMIISGTIQAHTFDVIQTNVIEIQASGSSNFGNDSSDVHAFSGSLHVVSGGIRKQYHVVTGSPYIVTNTDCILGVTNTGYTSIQLPNAITAGPGAILVIKDETTSTRSTANQIQISASTSPTQYIDREPTYSLTGDNPALSVYSNGQARWFIY